MLITGIGREFIIKDTHRGLWYEDGKLTKVLEAGRYKIPPQKRWFKRLPTVECLLVDVRQRELTIKGQEILTADKVAIRVSILVQFRVTDPKTGPVNFSKCCRFGCCAFDSGLMFGVGCVTA
jgi:regulator of protease activity HflC (stomatin/prohibitin superfamily)